MITHAFAVSNEINAPSEKISPHCKIHMKLPYFLSFSMNFLPFLFFFRMINRTSHFCLSDCVRFCLRYLPKQISGILYRRYFCHSLRFDFFSSLGRSKPNIYCAFFACFFFLRHPYSNQSQFMGYQGWDEILMITLIFSKKLGGYKIMRNTVLEIEVNNN